jgi:hypothetical protein
MEKNQDFFRSLLDALPAIVLVVDEDVRIQEYNAAAAALLTEERMTVLKRRAGEMFHCLHSADVPEGCGRGPACEHCVIRGAVTDAFLGNRVTRRRSKIELERNGERAMIYALITASPFQFQGKPLVLLIVEDINEIAELWRIIPICSICKKVRDDEQSWKRIEAYFSDHWDVDFSHGLCPDCYEQEMDKMEREIQAEQAASKSAADSQQASDEGPGRG